MGCIIKNNFSINVYINVVKVCKWLILKWVIKKKTRSKYRVWIGKKSKCVNSDLTSIKKYIFPAIYDIQDVSQVRVENLRISSYKIIQWTYYTKHPVSRTKKIADVRLYELFF